MKEKSLSVKIVCILIAILIYAIGFVCAPLEGLSVEGFRALCTLVAAVVLWMSEAIPPLITALLLLPGFTYAGVMAPNEFYSASSSMAVFFTLAGFGIGAALLNTNLATVIMGIILRRAKGNGAAIIRGVLILTAVVSVIVANYAAIIAVLGISAALVKCMGDPAPGTSGIAKGVMMAVPWGSMCGGIAMPCSNAINVALMNLLNAQTGIEVNFFQWSVVGIPCAILLTAFLAWWLPRYCKPENLSEEQIAKLNETYGKPVKLNAKDWKFIIIVGVMLVLWIASNWIKALDTARVALIGVGIMFLPGIDLINGKSYIKNLAPTGVIMLLCIMPIAGAISSTGAGAWIADNLFAGAAGWSMIFILIMMTVGSFILHLFVPSGNSVAALCGALLFGIAINSGITGPAICLILGMECGNNFLAAYDGIYAFTFGYGHYSFSDVLKCGVPATVVQAILCVVVAPLFAGLVA